MKMVYERPVMKAEVYATNAYCNVCGTALPAELITDPGHIYSTANGGKWQPGSGITADMLSHRFVQEDIYATVTGHCDNRRHTEEDRQQSIWACSCGHEDGSIWYLEYSHYYSDQQGKDVFCLYKDDGDGVFEILDHSNRFPANEGEDTNAGVAIYTVEDGNVVSNS